MPRTHISRHEARRLGEEAVEIIEAGSYKSVSGKLIEIRSQIDDAVRNTVSYPPEIVLPKYGQGDRSTIIEVLNETTLSAVKRLSERGMNPAALNFASATHPGGGFLNGARAQEEYLARSSALFACIRDSVMYEFHRGRHDPFYSDYVICSPGVPVFRSDDGSLYDEFFLCSVITSPAVNASAVELRHPERINNISRAMWTRILKVLAAARLHGHTSLVLGAWGCGAFGNDGNEMAGLFRNALTVNFSGAFEHVIFAVTDWSDD